MRTAVAAAALVVFTASATAYSGTVTAAGQQEVSTHSVDIELQEKEPQVGEESASISQERETARIQGNLQAPTPCHVLERRVTESNGEFTVDITTAKNDSQEICTQQVVSLEYTGTLKAETPYRVTVEHNGTKMTSQDIEAGDRSWIQRILPMVLPTLAED